MSSLGSFLLFQLEATGSVRFFEKSTRGYTSSEGLGLPIQLGGNFSFDIDALALSSNGAEREAGDDLV